ncbi:ATP phosphoribosyltransferase regulatory subunit [Rosenbergiella epipactidis]|uniref:ATP phosphoribosyltransferase regulatory subunit n=1 Tax=Rosenbergiella epipactidis TaxID=1544694 RepID=UPI0030C8749B
MGKLPRPTAMPRKNRLFIRDFPHLTQLRGHNGEPLFRQENDYITFEIALALAAKRYAVAIHSYSLAAERIFLMVTAKDRQSLSRFVQYIGRHYVPYYNRRYQRYGALWESRYACSPLQAGPYFLIVKRFIECDEDGTHSHHSDGLNPKNIIAPHPVWLELADDEIQQQQRFKDFCRSPVNSVLVTKICNTLNQNCLLATPAVSRRLESQLACSLRVRQRGRPRQYTSVKIDQWQKLEQHASIFLRQRGYQQVRLSMLEQEPLMATNSSTVIKPIQLRRDGTFGCLQMISRCSTSRSMSRVWYSGTMFGQEYCNHTIQQRDQIGVEAFGMPGIDIEIEQLVLQAHFFQRLGIASQIALHINMLGDINAFTAFRRALFAYYQPHSHLFTPEQTQQLMSHPEWLGNSPEDWLHQLAIAAPQLDLFVSQDSQQRFIRLQLALNQAGIVWHHDNHLYPSNEYCQVVFEWRSNNNVLSRGGRYDACASRILGYPIAACGFAFLVEPIARLLEQHEAQHHSLPSVDIVIIASQPRVGAQTVLLARQLRQQFPELRIATDSSQLRMATRHKNSRNQGAKITIEMEGDGYSLRLYKDESTDYSITNVDQISDQLGPILWL